MMLHEVLSLIEQRNYRTPNLSSDFIWFSVYLHQRITTTEILSFYNFYDASFIHQSQTEDAKPTQSQIRSTQLKIALI